MDKLKYIGVSVIIIGLFLLLKPVWAHGPDPVGTLMFKGILISVDAGKGTVILQDKKGKRYNVQIVKGSTVMICDLEGCHVGVGSRVFKEYKHTIPSGIPVVVDFDPKTGEVDKLDFHIDKGHPLDFHKWGDTEE